MYMYTYMHVTIQKVKATWGEETVKQKQCIITFRK